MKASLVHSTILARNVRPLQMTAEDVADYRALAAVGIDLPESIVGEMMSALDAAPDLQPTQYVGTIGTPVQFLQNFLPGFVNVMTQARKIDELIGIQTVGSWEDEEIIQGVLEPTGLAQLYGDYTNVPLASWNPSWERRTILRFENGFRVGKLEEARAGKLRINSAARKRASAGLALDIQRNRIGFYGYNGGANRTYGLLNDPSLGAYITVPNGVAGTPTWNTKTFLEITADVRAALTRLRTQSGDTIDPNTTKITIAVASNKVDFLGVTSIYGQSVVDWLSKTYPNVRIVSAPELNAANGGADVFYIYADQLSDDGSDDGGQTIVQLVPTKFRTIGVEQQAKAYVEDFSNATAGVMVKRPYAVARYTGI